jgi:proteasome lid subunit RPN8/RPN11
MVTFCPSGDFQALTATHSQQGKMDIKQQLIDIATPHINDEVCGFICKNEKGYFYVPSVNRSPEPDTFFYISSIDFLKIKSDNNLVAIFHNHMEDSEDPSEFDRVVAENICYPMVIYSNLTRNFSVFIPKHIDCDVKDVDGLRELLND